MHVSNLRNVSRQAQLFCHFALKATDAATTMTCPQCSGALEAVKMRHGLFWSCRQCGGRALGVDLLRRTFVREAINRIWRRAVANEGANGRACPSCHQQMIEVAATDQPEPRVEVCRFCHFVWFDTHEIERFTPLPPPKPSEPELPQKVREMIAIARVEQIAREAEGSDWASEPPDEWWKTLAGFLGMPIEYDAPIQERKPWITWLLAATIAAFSVFAFRDLGRLVQEFGLIPVQATRLGGAMFVTSFFLHGGIVHLAGNLYFLLIFGDNVEDYLGRVRYALLIAFAAVAGNLLHITLHPESTLPCIGASGGISGIIMFYALKFPQIRLGFALRWYFHLHWIRLRAWVALVLWTLLQMFGVWQQLAGFSNVSAVAHLGGAAVGFIAWLISRKNDSLPST